jgi:hypothetical protein
MGLKPDGGIESLSRFAFENARFAQARPTFTLSRLPQLGWAALSSRRNPAVPNQIAFW